jgi:hypothetical protein
MHAESGEWTRDRAAGFVLVTMGDMVLFGSPGGRTRDATDVPAPIDRADIP